MLRHPRARPTSRIERGAARAARTLVGRARSRTFEPPGPAAVRWRERRERCRDERCRCFCWRWPRFCLRGPPPRPPLPNRRKRNPSPGRWCEHRRSRWTLRPVHGRKACDRGRIHLRHRRACPGDPDQLGTAVPYDRGGRDKPGDEHQRGCNTLAAGGCAPTTVRAAYSAAMRTSGCAARTSAST
jgi:hypothetical protein